jgi:hypothetical protein
VLRQLARHLPVYRWRDGHRGDGGARVRGGAGVWYRRRREGPVGVGSV